MKSNVYSVSLNLTKQLLRAHTHVSSFHYAFWSWFILILFLAPVSSERYHRLHECICVNIWQPKEKRQFQLFSCAERRAHQPHLASSGWVSWGQHVCLFRLDLLYSATRFHWGLKSDPLLVSNCKPLHSSLPENNREEGGLLSYILLLLLASIRFAPCLGFKWGRVWNPGNPKAPLQCPGLAGLDNSRSLDSVPQCGELWLWNRTAVPGRFSWSENNAATAYPVSNTVYKPWWIVSWDWRVP